ncbi:MULTISPECIES: DUF6113 family protein [Streptomyces]|uniref:Integral membrane protein n=2 Tax=Streptomyces TaxID=1883 RepID=A0ABT9LL83_STRGD|nr:MULTISPECIES: DUF6113 family protein [Streptomyces]MDP9683901.1 hypothetical protein [Streptomyces griseoviridis]GGS85895.1 hypothetical protein GCM10010240_19190 [Streptomyces griseoviridis]GGU40610.1 hypothetical protein GCM10010259_34190 [Streptomyces daghestanicus]GHI31146.1 hypothetical protein Sdagh_28760 [Streptomyces daghestanicus]
MSGRTGPAGQPPLLARPLRPPSAGRAVLHLLLLVLGALTGVAGALVQPAWFPGGLLLALAAEAGLVVGAARAAGHRGAAVAAAVGWAAAVIFLTASRPEGDFLFAAGSGSYLFLLGGIAVAVICATLAPVRQPDGDPVRLGK